MWGGVFPKAVKGCTKWWGGLARLIRSSRQKNVASPAGCYPGATGDGGIASSSFLSTCGKPLPILLYAQADNKLRDMAAKFSKIDILELFAAIATVYQLRDALWGRNASGREEFPPMSIRQTFRPGAELSYPNELKQELATIDEHFTSRNLSWMLQHADWAKLSQCFTSSDGRRNHQVPRTKRVRCPSPARAHARQLT